MQDSRAPFQPDPLQLKLSSLGAAPTAMLSSGSEFSSYSGSRGGGQRGEYIIEQKGHVPSHYAVVREVHSEPYGRRMAGDTIRCVCVYVSLDLTIGSINSTASTLLIEIREKGYSNRSRLLILCMDQL